MAIHAIVRVKCLLLFVSQSAGGYDDMQDVAASSPRSQRPHGGGQTGNIRARFENMASTEEEVCT